ncbi:Uncharacterized protein, contains SIS (Sugar ISomerase) phosphosugar binding domain [Thermanaeromonas toyohensis ToBE]|uniref:Uncharacterized protein, contains SIS (Sugar ISomerase) phosphosugar binding domain n=1 Tax=Thermanaeromonas toyohensis ToBE TaxID=698762 RepID=A0A1W1VVL7_9FIRM|nr:Uncharacterized protein, contains SIS (Sugar ISomerase) phosphosugar binding domain [Thermanaeromonas toyohensis ToBE]
MLAQQYYHQMRKVLERIEQTQGEALEKAAELIVESLAQGGTWHLMDTGHMLNHEMIGRAGGMMAITPLQVMVEVYNPVRPSRVGEKKSVYLDRIEGLGEFVIAKSGMLPGDVLVIGSVSGYNMLPVEVAIQAKSQGIKVIALTSVAYSSTLQSRHPSGLRLYEVADVVLDHGAPPGDALVEVAGLPVKICPASGIAAAYLMWALQAEVIEKMLKRGLVPQVYMSNHLPGADEFNRRAKKEFAEKGY